MTLTRIATAREFALMYSRRCNIACRHCGIESSPRVKERMRLDDARRFIVEAAAIPDFAKVTFTGGEPMMFPDEIEELVALCTSLGLSTRIVTNGFWAKTRRRGLNFLRRFRDAGLTELNFSADKYHLEFLPAETLRNALDVARELDYSRIVSFVSNAESEPLSTFAELYGVPRERLMDLRTVLRDESRIAELSRDYVFIFYGGLIGLGRAAEFPQELRYYPLDFYPAGQECGEIVNKPVIYPDGSFQACCCAGGKIAAFTVGNANDTSIVELYEAMQARSHYRLINTHGPRTLFDCIRKARPDLRLPERYTSICELCVRATRDLPAAEVDRIADDFLLRETLKVFGIEPAPAQPVDA